MQTLKEDFNSVVFQQDELKYRNLFLLVALLPNLANRDSDFNLGNKMYDLKKKRSSQKQVTD